jgi:hypothetical protein
MSIYDYIRAQRANLASITRLPHFGLIVLVDNLYNRGLDLFKSHLPKRYGQFLVLSHQSLLSAATLIAQAQPFDAGPITRRAVEVARLCLASRFDKEAGRKWLAFEKRQARWEARQEGKKPPRLPTINYDIKDNPLMESLNEQIGILSDSCVHFTPEYHGSQNWKIQKESASHGKLTLSYFISDQLTIEREFILLAKTHKLILEVIDECVDHAFRNDEQFRGTVTKLVQDGDILAATFSRAIQKKGRA